MLDNPETTTKLLAERPMGSFKCGHAERVLALAGCCAGDHLSGFGRKVRAYARPQQREKGRTLVNEPSEFYDLRRISAHPADGSQSDSRDISAIIIRQWHPNLKSPCEPLSVCSSQSETVKHSAAVAAFAGSGHDNPFRKIVQLRRQGWRTVQSRQRYLGEFAACLFVVIRG